MKLRTWAAATVALLLSTGAAFAQTAAPEWRTIAPENLLVIDTSKGRIIVELDPQVAPLHVERIRTLADQGFYDGLKFHRVIEGFMAQTGDPEGTGAGGSELPDVQAELQFRRGRADGFLSVLTQGTVQFGVLNSLSVVTQPDAQMFATRDMKAGAQALFCPGVAGMARSGNVNSANSQFFLMTGASPDLDGGYTAFGRVLAGMDVVRALNTGPESANGKVENPDLMTRARTAAAMPEGQRPTARVMDPRNPRFAEIVAQARAAGGATFDVCDLQPPAEVTGA
ncbi:peptidylprolyl isomerase [Rhizobium sp. CRIBSB]|nr:peptidylprolyl isomerase [Rhizobium sp. CRIBSB]